MELLLVLTSLSSSGRKTFSVLCEIKGFVRFRAEPLPQHNAELTSSSCVKLSTFHLRCGGQGCYETR